MLLLWITSYLRNWSQFVKIRSKSSTATLLDLRCSSGFGAGAIIIVYIDLTSWRSHLELWSWLPSIHWWCTDVQHCQHKALIDVDIKIIETCMLAVQEWFLNDLLNPAKSEVIALGTTTVCHKRFQINVTGSPLHFVNKVKSLSVYIDLDLSVDAQFYAICRSCNYQICTFRHPSLSADRLRPEDPKIVSCCIIGSQFDYCNSHMYGISEKKWM